MERKRRRLIKEKEVAAMYKSKTHTKPHRLSLIIYPESNRKKKHHKSAGKNAKNKWEKQEWHPKPTGSRNSNRFWCFSRRSHFAFFATENFTNKKIVTRKFSRGSVKWKLELCNTFRTHKKSISALKSIRLPPSTMLMEIKLSQYDRSKRVGKCRFY